MSRGRNAMTKMAGSKCQISFNYEENRQEIIILCLVKYICINFSCLFTNFMYFRSLNNNKVSCIRDYRYIKYFYILLCKIICSR